MYIGLLPIGSIVRLDGAENCLMIIGYFAKTESNPEHVWDYVGTVYPGGILDTNQTYQFDKEQIVEIKYIGYEDEEQQEFIMKLNLAEPQIKNQID